MVIGEAILIPDKMLERGFSRIGICLSTDITKNAFSVLYSFIRARVGLIKLLDEVFFDKMHILEGRLVLWPWNLREGSELVSGSMLENPT